MISWILDKLFSVIPFLHERGKRRSAARAKLQQLRAQLILFALQGKMYAGKFDQELIEWANEQISSSPDLSQHEEYGQVQEGLEKILEQPKEIMMAMQIMRPKEQNVTKFFPQLEKPVIEELHLSSHDIALNSELGSKINAINAMSKDLRSLHNKTFNDLNDHQQNAIIESITSTYLNISKQSQIASQKIAEMSLIKS